MTRQEVRDRYHGHPYEIVIPFLTLEEANAEKTDLHAAVEARAFIRPAADVRIDAVRKTVEILAQGGADEGDYGAGQESLAREILDLLTDAKHAADMIDADRVCAVLAEVSPEPDGACSCTLTEGDDADSSYVERLIRQDPACPTHRPVPGGVLDRDQARAYLLGPEGVPGIETRPDVVEEWLDFLAGCVRPAAIDRDALTALIHRIQEETDGDADLGDWTPQYVAEFLALVRPVAGVTLTPEEAAALTRVLAALRRSGGISIADLPSAAEMDRLAARLEAAS